MYKFKADVFNCEDNGPCIRLLIEKSPAELNIQLLELEAAATLLNLLQAKVERCEARLKQNNIYDGVYDV